jgi:hypothetical protein
MFAIVFASHWPCYLLPSRCACLHAQIQTSSCPERLSACTTRLTFCARYWVTHFQNKSFDFFSVYLQTVIAVVSYVAKVPDGNNLHDSYSITIVLYSLDFSNLSVPSYRPDPTGILVSSRRLHCAQLLQSSCGSRTQIFPLSSNNPDISGCDLVVISPSMVVVYVHH